jgi:hypothetical protein
MVLPVALIAARATYSIPQSVGFDPVALRSCQEQIGLPDLCTSEIVSVARPVMDKTRRRSRGRGRVGGVVCFPLFHAPGMLRSSASTVCACLWFKSRYIPRALAAFGMVSSAFCVACTLVFYIFPDFDKIVNLWWFDTPMGIFDIALSFWLLFKGLRPPGTTEDHPSVGPMSSSERLVGNPDRRFCLPAAPSGSAVSYNRSL